MTTIAQLHKNLVKDIKSIKSPELTAELKEKLRDWKAPQNYLKLLKILFDTSKDPYKGLFHEFIGKKLLSPNMHKGYLQYTHSPITNLYLGYILSINQKDIELTQEQFTQDEEYLIEIYEQQIQYCKDLTKDQYKKLLHYLSESKPAIKPLVDSIIKNIEKPYRNFDVPNRLILQLIAKEDGCSKYLEPLYRIEGEHFPSLFSNLILECYSYQEEKINTQLERLLSSYADYQNQGTADNDKLKKSLGDELRNFHQFIHNDTNYSQRFTDEKSKETLKGILIAVAVVAALIALASTLIIPPLAASHIIGYTLFLSLFIPGTVTSTLMGIGVAIASIFLEPPKIDAPIMADKITKEITKNTGIQFFDKKPPAAIVEETADSSYNPC